MFLLEMKGNFLFHSFEELLCWVLVFIIFIFIMVIIVIFLILIKELSHVCMSRLCFLLFFDAFTLRLNNKFPFIINSCIIFIRITNHYSGFFFFLNTFRKYLNYLFFFTFNYRHLRDNYKIDLLRKRSVGVR